MFFGHAPAALLITTAWFLLLGFPCRNSPVTPRLAALGGAIAGLAVATEYPTAILVVVIFATLLIRRTGLSTLPQQQTGALAGTLPALVYHQIAFGAPWIYGLFVQGRFRLSGNYCAWCLRHFMAIGRGSLGSPVQRQERNYLLLPSPSADAIGLLSMVRSNRWRDAGPILIAAVSYVLFAAGFVDWTAGWCAAARHLVPILPLVVVVALFAATQLAERRWGALIVVVLISISGVNAVLTIVLTPFFPPEFGAPLAQLVLPSLADGVGFSNVLTSALGITPSAAVALTLIIVVAALIWAAGRMIRVRAWWLPAISLVTVAVLLLTYSWQGFAPTIETEFMRSQVLRRLGHTEVADRIEVTSIPPATLNTR